MIGFTEKTTKALRHKERSKKILKIVPYNNVKYDVS
jgi:hypothetical protein